MKTKVNYLIVNPETFNKLQGFEDAKELCLNFLKHNNIAPPASIINGLPTGRRMTNKYLPNGCYDYNTHQLYVNLKKTKTPVKTPGFCWSFTGNKADLTVGGVMAHEFGHHVHYMIGRDKVLKLLDNSGITKIEAPVTSYEPNLHEVFAEMMKLFITNPMLLKERRPLRYRFLTEVLGLKPLHHKPWREILKHAHPRIVTQASKF